MRDFKRHIVFLLSISFFCIDITIGQSLAPTRAYIANVQHFSTEDGLSHRAVYTTFQDSKGFIWFGTQYGLNRFNGKQFEVFTKEKHGLAHNQVNLILEDAEGWLWVFQSRSSTGKARAFLNLSFVNVHTLEVKTVAERFGTDFPLTIRQLYSAISDKNKSIYLGTNDGKILRFHPASGFQVKVIKEEGTIDTYAFFDSHNTLVINTKEDHAIITLDTSLNKLWQRKFDQDWKKIVADQKGLIWWIEQSEGITEVPKINFSTSDFYPDLQACTIPKVYEGIVLRGLKDYYYDPKSDHFWYNDFDNIFVFHPARGMVYDVGKIYPEIAKSQISHIFLDHQNNAWISTATGVFHIQLTVNSFKKYLALPINAYNLAEAASTRGILRHGNKLWVNDVVGKTTEINLTDHSSVGPAPFATIYNGVNRLVSNYTSIPFDEEHLLFGGEGIGLLNTKTKEYRLIPSAYIWEYRTREPTSS